MSEYRTGVVFRQLALVPLPDSSDFGRCLKSELENPREKKCPITFFLVDGTIFFSNEQFWYIEVEHASGETSVC